MAWVLAGPRLDRSGLTWAVKPRFGGGPRACPRGLTSQELSQELHGLPYRVSGLGPWCLYSWNLGRDMEFLGLVSANAVSRASMTSSTESPVFASAWKVSYNDPKFMACMCVTVTGTTLFTVSAKIGTILRTILGLRSLFFLLSDLDLPLMEPLGLDVGQGIGVQVQQTDQAVASDLSPDHAVAVGLAVLVRRGELRPGEEDDLAVTGLVLVLGAEALRQRYIIHICHPPITRHIPERNGF